MVDQTLTEPMLWLLQGTYQTVLQSSPGVDLWQVIGFLGSILLVAMGAYGTLILQNRTTVKTLRQRLFGADGDESDEGFVQETEQRLDTMAAETEQRLDNMDSQISQHAKQTHTQLYKLDQKMDVVLDIVTEEHQDIRLPNSVEGVEDVPPPPGDFYRGGGSPNAHNRQPAESDDPPASDD